MIVIPLLGTGYFPFPEVVVVVFSSAIVYSEIFIGIVMFTNSI